jgi:predicted nucleotidyltransferase
MPDKLFPELQSPVQALEARLCANWGHIRRARERANSKREELRSELAGFDSEDTSVVVFGSLARDEFTDGSDIDWTLLIDGSADPKHLELVHAVDQVIAKLATKPTGREGTFGKMIFSHDLIHQIGGEDDTNRNTTQRILLLLESAVVGRKDAHDRVINGILQRYLSEDEAFIQRKSRYHVPRFLLNDFGRYWRTMAVDFAYKRRTRFGQGAALRNIKLRMSRKLIYISGMLTCFSCELQLPDITGSRPPGFPPAAAVCIDCLRRFLRQTPLEILAGTLIKLGNVDDLADSLFGSYDQFLGILSDARLRKRLDELDPQTQYEDETFLEARKLTHQFRDALLDLFFERDRKLSSLTKIYGVF